MIQIKNQIQLKSQLASAAFGATLLAATCAPQTANAQVIKAATAKDVKAKIAAQKGKLTVVNFWATWCPPCVAEMPALAKLKQNYTKRGMALVLVSADDPATRDSKVKPFLKKNKLAGSWLISGSQERFIDAFDPSLKGAFALPRTYIYNRKGKLVKSFSGDKTYAEWEKLLKPLL